MPAKKAAAHEPPDLHGSFAADSAVCQKYWRASEKLRAAFPPKADCNVDQAKAVASNRTRARELREQFLAKHTETLYGKLTNNRRNFIRVEQMVADAAKLVPGLVPSDKELAAEAPLALKDKENCRSIRASSCRTCWPTKRPDGTSVRRC